jgi:DNA repair exonuclease SbcCD ATPase subunit
MKPPSILIQALAALAGTVLLATPVRADDPQPPTREELREQLKNLTPAEREARLKELRARHGEPAPNVVPGPGPGGPPPEQREAIRRRFAEQFQNLPPEEREAKMRELREQFERMSPEERAARLREFQGKAGERGSVVPGNPRTMREQLPGVSPEQREARLREFRVQMEARYKDLKAKEAAGTLSPEERGQLQRLEQFRQAGDPFPPRRPGGNP